MPAPQAPAPLLPGSEGRHYEQIKAAIPQSLINASPSLRAAIRQVKAAEIPAWYSAISPAQKDQLKSLVEASFNSHAALEQSMHKVQEASAFGQPLLEAALREKGYVLDVNQTYVRLYNPVEDSFGRRTGGFKTQTFSLLQAALNNFEEPATRAGFFNSASGFITAPDAEGHFERHPTSLTVEVFAQLCRTLDLGSQYQDHLTTFLRPTQTVSKNLLHDRFIARQKDAFKAAAYVALLKGDIGADDHALLMRVASGERRIMLGDKQVWYRRPCIMNLHLHGCVIIDPCVQYRYSNWFIAYIPDDPEHPIKRYESFAEFRQELTRQLTQWPNPAGARPTVPVPTDYQHFLSRFIARKDLAYFYRRFTEEVEDAPDRGWALKWLRSEKGQFWSSILEPNIRSIESVLGGPAHTVRVPQQGPNLHIECDSMKGLWVDVDLWEELYDGTRKRMFEDALVMAVPTIMADANHRHRRLSHYMNLGLLVLNLVSMAIPPLGALMAVVTAGQLLYEVLEGAIELSEGDREAGWSHVGDVLENVAMLAVGGAAFHFTVSPFIEGLKSVRLPSGAQRLWKPNIEPYALKAGPPATSTPDEVGVHHLPGRRVLALSDRHYVLNEDPYSGQYRIQHPERAEAYQPQIRHNGSGAWLHEAQRPLRWRGPTLMRRLGPVLNAMSDGQLEAIRRISDVDDSVLRRLHAESEPTPALLRDTIRRFQVYSDVGVLGEQIRAGRLSESLCDYAALLMVDMRGWPASKAIQVFHGTGEPIQYGDVAARDLIRISRADLMAGKLAERVVDALDEQPLKALLGQHLPEGRVLRSEQLQARLADHAQNNVRRLFQSRYSEAHLPRSLEVETVQRDFPRLPNVVAEELLSNATPGEREALRSTRKIPFPVARQARLMQAQLRLTRAYEGAYLPGLAGPDTEALVLNTLEQLPGWRDSLRLEVRDGSFNGTLRASSGSPQAAARKVLVRVGAGRYQAYDTNGQTLHGIDGLYESLQHALTDAHRIAVGLRDVGQGLALQEKVQQHLLPRDRLRLALGMQSVKRPFFEPPRLLADGRRGYPLSGRGPGSRVQQINDRLRDLYPDITDEEIEAIKPDQNPLNDGWLTVLENEHRTLMATLQRWAAQHKEGVEQFGPEDRAALKAKRRILQTLDDAWRRVGPRDNDRNGVYQGQKITWDEVELHEQLRTLPALSADFNYVSRIELVEMSVTSDDLEPFLANFRGLRHLGVEACELTRLPVAIARMPHLKNLYLGANEIVLTPQAVLQLKDMTQLEELGLDNNPLGMAPDVSRMAELRLLWLGGTGLQEWPASVFRLSRPRQFILDIRDNFLSRIPVFAPGSDNALIVARTALSREHLAPALLDQFKLYIEAAGNDPQRQFPVRGAYDSRLWKTGLSEDEWLGKQPLWDFLEQSLGSEPFFNELRALRNSGDASVDGGRLLPELTEKVWRMLEAMGESAELRDELFRMAGTPTACVDAGAQLFNAMGVEVLRREAYLSDDPNVVRRAVFKLARGKWRMDELGRIAHDRVAQLLALGVRYPEYDEEGARVIHVDEAGEEILDIDEVEIYLAYTARLATRLDLPWQAKSMLYREEYVTPQMIEAAFERVMTLDQGEQLRTNLLEQPMWTDFLQKANKADYAKIQAKFEALIDYQAAQADWAGDGNLSDATKDTLRLTIDRTARLLGRSSNASLPGTLMSQEEYTASFIQIDSEYSALGKTLTDQAITAILGT
ncbi:DUF6543 domain-containing protein [Pseudomonas sp. MWU16-30323]|uniref:dermonecrotic toxin domain-containing protein n=1 Tax=Pseudomonas sp. MWU16-30323 TaxID=2878094 RepID=UPI001CF96D41|nr:DUF6543 domain-containing protein [Pseudomonas sp. MWU16-30323]